MEQKTAINPPVSTDAHFSSEDVSRIRVRPSADGQSSNVELIGTDQAIFDRQSALLAAQKEQQTRAEVEAGRAFVGRHFGGKAGSDKSAQVFAAFDRNNPNVQPAEFYRYSDPEVDRFGYF